ncbi:MAG: hypothetical protein MJY87_07850 [Fibrobacter sp.]|nr:hypothetical protein [Fibrobacter sp.]
MNNEEMETEVVETDSADTAAKASNSMKKFKILLIVDIVLIVGLFVMMMLLKGSYEETAKSSFDAQITAYRDGVDATIYEQWKSVDQYNMAWNLVYATLSGNKTVAAFDETAKKIEGDKETRLKQVAYIYSSAGVSDKAVNTYAEKAGLAESFLLKNEANVKEVACGKGCVVTFNFDGKKLKSVDYEALKKIDMAGTFKVGEPAPYHFD